VDIRLSPSIPDVNRAIGFALAAAVLFGFGTPAAKVVVAATDPWVTASLLYLGSGVGLGCFRFVQRALGQRSREAPLRRVDLPWLAAAIISGGGIGPVLLMFGLARGSAGQAALLLNAEGVLTALVAWCLFGEHVGRTIAIGMALITAGALVVAWHPHDGMQLGEAPLLVIGACLAWAVDNNLTRKVSGGDPLLIAALKGGAAGAANLAIAIASGARFPDAGAVLAATVIGLLGYGVSLVLFVIALRDLGAARTGAYFSTAPFLGALASVAILHEPFTAGLAVGGGLMAVGVWLHVTERHSHEHGHEPLTHIFTDMTIITSMLARPGRRTRNRMFTSTRIPRCFMPIRTTPICITDIPMNPTRDDWIVGDGTMTAGEKTASPS
jgi:drug/metabolite transporter (DMT)-like permease